MESRQNTLGNEYINVTHLIVKIVLIVLRLHYITANK